LIPGSAVVEVGPGTGQATRPLAERDLRILAVEVGPHLAARARQNLASYPDVEVVTTSYEAWDPGSARFHAVFAQDDYVAVGGERVDPATKHPDRVGDVGSAVRASGLFEEPVLRRYRFDIAFTADNYALNLSTQSGIKEFPPDAQAELISRIRRRVLRRGGTVTAHLLAVLMVARGVKPRRGALFERSMA
jgi:hypothetical protein